MGMAALGVISVLLSLAVAVSVGVGSAWLSQRQWFMKHMKYTGLGLMTLPLAAIWFTGCGYAMLFNSNASKEIGAVTAIVVALISPAVLLIEFVMACGILMLANSELRDGALYVRQGSLVDKFYRWMYKNPYVWEKTGKSQDICFLSWNLAGMILLYTPLLLLIQYGFPVIGSVFTLLFSGSITEWYEKQVLGETETKLDLRTRRVMSFAPIVPLGLAATIVLPVGVGMFYFGYSLTQVLATYFGLTSGIMLLLAMMFGLMKVTIIKTRPKAMRLARFQSETDHEAMQPARSQSKVDRAVIVAGGRAWGGIVRATHLLALAKEAACPTIKPGG